MRHMQSQYSPISLLRNSPITSTPHYHSKIPGGFYSYHVQSSIKFLQWCTKSSLRRNFRFHPSEIIHHLEAMGGILHMAANPIISRVSQGPRSIPPYFCVTYMDRNPSCRRTPHSKTKRGELLPLCGENIRGSGDHRTQTQHSGKP